MAAPVLGAVGGHRTGRRRMVQLRMVRVRTVVGHEKKKEFNLRVHDYKHTYIHNYVSVESLFTGMGLFRALRMALFFLFLVQYNTTMERMLRVTTQVEWRTPH